MTTAEEAQPGDAVVEHDGAKVFLDETAAVALGDQVLDASVDQAGAVQFSLLPSSSPSCRATRWAREGRRAPRQGPTTGGRALARPAAYSCVDGRGRRPVRRRRPGPAGQRTRSRLAVAPLPLHSQRRRPAGSGDLDDRSTTTSASGSSQRWSARAARSRRGLLATARREGRGTPARRRSPGPWPAPWRRGTPDVTPGRSRAPAFACGHLRGALVRLDEQDARRATAERPRARGRRTRRRGRAPGHRQAPRGARAARTGPPGRGRSSGGCRTRRCRQPQPAGPSTDDPRHGGNVAARRGRTVRARARPAPGRRLRAGARSGRRAGRRAAGRGRRPAAPSTAGGRPSPSSTASAPGICSPRYGGEAAEVARGRGAPRHDQGGTAMRRRVDLDAPRCRAAGPARRPPAAPRTRAAASAPRRSRVASSASGLQPGAHVERDRPVDVAGLEQPVLLLAVRRAASAGWARHRGRRSTAARGTTPDRGGAVASSRATRPPKDDPTTAASTMPRWSRSASRSSASAYSPGGMRRVAEAARSRVGPRGRRGSAPGRSASHMRAVGHS